MTARRLSPIASSMPRPAPDGSPSLADDLEARLDEQRLLARALMLLEIPSFSGHETAIAEAYAVMLAGAGIDVAIDRAYPESPSVVGRSGSSERPGPSSSLRGTSTPCPFPDGAPRIDGGRLYGRGRRT